MKKILSGLVVLALLIAMISMVSVGLAEDTAVKTGFGVVSGFSGTKNANRRRRWRRAGVPHVCSRYGCTWMAKL